MSPHHCLEYKKVSKSLSLCVFYPHIYHILVFELSDIQYGDITCDVAEALCSQPGEYLIRRGITDNDFKFTIRQYSGYSHFTIYRERHVSGTSITKMTNI